jgi:hypothetical protein
LKPQIWGKVNYLLGGSKNCCLRETGWMRWPRGTPLSKTVNYFILMLQEICMHGIEDDGGKNGQAKEGKKSGRYVAVSWFHEWKGSFFKSKEPDVKDLELDRCDEVELG